MLPEALERHRAFLRRMEAYFGLAGRVRYVDDPSTPDIAAIPSANTILIGKRWHRAGPEEREKRLTHEAAHLWGLPHSEAMRTIGYFSRPERDRWSRRVYQDIQAGTPRFDPAKFGASAMADKHRGGYGEERRQLPHRPNPDPAGTLLSIGIAAGALFAGYLVLRQSLGGVLGDGGGSWGPGARTSACGWYPYRQGNTDLALDVRPTDPPARAGEDIYYSGRLTRKLFGLSVPGWEGVPIPIVNAHIDFWDAQGCEAFGYAVTGADGTFSVVRQLQPDELGGYRLFAAFEGGPDPNDFARVHLDPASTGVWTVRPR